MNHEDKFKVKRRFHSFWEWMFYIKSDYYCTMDAIIINSTKTK